MKYKVWTNGKEYKLQKKTLWWWAWLDCTRVWCNWYGRGNPKIFYSEKEVLDYLKSSVWKVKEHIVKEGV